MQYFFYRVLAHFYLFIFLAASQPFFSFSFLATKKNKQKVGLGFYGCGVKVSPHTCGFMRQTFFFLALPGIL